MLSCWWWCLLLPTLLSFLFRLPTTNLPKNQKFSSHIRTKCIRTRIPTRKMQTCSYRLLFDFHRNSYYFVAISLLALIPDFDTTLHTATTWIKIRYVEKFFRDNGEMRASNRPYRDRTKWIKENTGKSMHVTRENETEPNITTETRWMNQRKIWWVSEFVVGVVGVVVKGNNTGTYYVRPHITWLYIFISFWTIREKK